MPRSASNGVNKSQAIRDLLTKNPSSTAKEVIEQLGSRGIKIHPNLFYFTKGKMKGRKGRHRKMRRQVESVMASGNGAVARTDVLATINKVKGLASEVGGMKKLAAIVAELGGV